MDPRLLSLLNSLSPPTQSARTADGTGNNEDDPALGAASTPLIRLGEPSYADGVSQLDTTSGNPREISDLLVQQPLSQDEPNSSGASNLLWAWGQFLDHDISLTPEAEDEPAVIPILAGDPYFDPMGLGTAVIPFMRSEHEPEEEGEARSFPNIITSFIDASMVYGSSDTQLAALRGDKGRLRIGEDGLLLSADDGDGVLAGDVRAGENVVLLSLHTLFVREHNRLVAELSDLDPSMDEDALFLAARARVEGLIQAITFNEFLPILLGPNALPAYGGYDPSVNPSLSVEFTTAAFRLGHSLLSSEIARQAEGGGSMPEGSLSLRGSFQQPYLLGEAGGIGAILRGTAATPAQELDTQIIEDVRSFLFGPPGAGGLDLASLNMQRGRDHGIPKYNDLREAVGLPRAESFADITSDPVLQAALRLAYGDVDAIESWVGGLAEDAVNGGMVGELFFAILVDQFSRLRDGDSHWSQRVLSETEQAQIWSTTLGDVIERNTDIVAIQDLVFIAGDRMMGTDDADAMAGTETADFMWGGKGNDVMDGHAGPDAVEGNAGDDRLTGGAGDDRVSGGSGNDSLFGGSGSDHLDGGSGNDRLDGGVGDDDLTGGSGQDIFVFNLESGVDRVTDFVPGIDRIDLSGLVDPAAVLDGAIDGPAGVTLMVGTGGIVLLLGVSAANLDLADFIQG